MSNNLELFSEKNTFASVLLAAAVKAYGIDILQWDPETIYTELKDEVENLSDENYNKFMAAVELVTTDKFYYSLPAFIRLCNVLYSGTYNADTWDPADMLEICWGILEGKLIWPEDSFSEQILGYIKERLKYEGFMLKPKALMLEIDTSDLIPIDETDDPELFKAMYQRAKEKADALDSLVVMRFSELIDQLASLTDIKKLFEAIEV